MIVLGKIYTSIQVQNLEVIRNQTDFNVYFKFQDKEGRHSVSILGVRDVEEIGQLFEAERLWINKDDDSQVEYGIYTLGISSEAYYEFPFDKLNI